MSATPDHCCNVCVYFVQFNEDHRKDGDGCCRRFPPIPTPVADGDGETVSVDCLYPRVALDDWCGECRAS